MKIIGTFGGVMMVSMALLQPAEGGSRVSGRSSGFQSFGGARQFSAPARNFSSGGARFQNSSPRFQNSSRFSSGATFRNRSFSSSGTRPAAFRQDDFRTQGVNTRGTFHNRSRWDGQRSGVNRSADFQNRSFNNNTSRVAGRRDGNWSGRNRSFNNDASRIVGRRSGNWNRHWDRRREHNWRGHRCRWINNSWVIFATGFYPYGYGYYPYGGYYPYSAYYYDDGYYTDRYAADEYSQSSDSDEGAVDSNVSEVQSALSREGYYSGAVDGSFGPETQTALRRFQRARRLNVTGRIDRATMNALGLQG